MLHGMSIEEIRRLCDRIKRDGIRRLLNELQPKLEAQRRRLFCRPAENVLY